ncbi:gluconolaconase [Novosphingobium sp. FSY-8]|uniref:Gluconolaconase n=1 Tax=Novosphingobium ovatum TaxID=1908523 RepID=A0ABW9XHK7_9SPHN|nr:SMP-30/gluconolactonase/LRE family protein [Novosphingobium ovatum]NBC38047.1 gluconolaconase [Novosphingobium ovatum]
MADSAPAACAPPPEETPPFTVLASGYGFVEGPRVEPDGTLWFSDLTGGGYYRVTPDGTATAFAPQRQWIGGAVMCGDGALILSGRGGLARLDPADGGLTPIAVPLTAPCELCINDIEAAPDGSLIGGSIDFAAIMERGEAPAPGTLFHLSPDGTLTLLRDDVHASNGLGFSPCGRWLYHSETSRGVWRYPLGADGVPGAGTLFAELEDSDGLIVDAGGGVWVACWASGTLRHYTQDGVWDRLIRLPFPHLVSLAVGGPDLHDLYVSTGGNADHPGMGGVVRIRIDVPGQRDYITQVPA